MVVKFLFQWFALFFICETLYPQFGTLDPSFGNGGKVVTVFGTENALIHALAVQPDGKILASGTFAVNNQNQMALARYHTYGTLDATFGDQGKVIVPIADSNSFIFIMVLQPDGKIVACGRKFTMDYSDFQYFLVRFNNDGNLDTTFGTQGIVIPFEAEEIIEIKALAVQPDGKITAVGSIKDSGNYSNFLLLRFNTDGTPDAGFGTAGIVSRNFRVIDYANALALLPDGKILVVGSSSDVGEDGHDYDFIIAQFNSDGTLNTFFGDDGKTFIGVAGEGETALYVKIQPDGKIVVAGEHDFPYGFQQVRLLSNGIPDTDFGTNGSVITEVPTSKILAMTSQVDGKIVAAGYYNPGAACCSVVRLFRFTANGDLDPTFGVNGIVSQGSEVGQARALAMQLDGKILISSGGGIGAGPNHTDFVMYRYLSGLNLSVADFNNGSNFMIYPNPVKEELTVNFNLPNSESLNMVLYDYSGKEIVSLLAEQQFDSGVYSKTFVLPGWLSKGFYFLRISKGKTIETFKIIKL